MSESLSILDQNSIRDDQIRWEYIKFKIRQFSITFSKNLLKSLNAEREILEKELKMISKNPVQVTLIQVIQPLKQNLIRSMIRKLRVIELEGSVTGTKKEENLLNSS